MSSVSANLEGRPYKCCQAVKFRTSLGFHSLETGSVAPACESPLAEVNIAPTSKRLHSFTGQHTVMINGGICPRNRSKYIAPLSAAGDSPAGGEAPKRGGSALRPAGNRTSRKPDAAGDDSTCSVVQPSIAHLKLILLEFRLLFTQ